MSVAAIEAAADAILGPLCAFLDNEGPLDGTVQGLWLQYEARVHEVMRAHDAVRPPGKLAPDHPWHLELHALLREMAGARMIVRPIVKRAAAKAAGRLVEYDREVDAWSDAAGRVGARFAAEVDRREARIGHALPANVTRAIAASYGLRGDRVPG